MKVNRIKIRDIYDDLFIPERGDFAYLSGDIVIMRDMAHKKYIKDNERHVDFKDKAIFYAGPLRSGILGPTTSSRMDPMTLWFAQERGVRLFIGKGERDSELISDLRKIGAYCASVPGGLSSYLSMKIDNPTPYLYKSMGCEAIFFSKVRNILVKFL